MTQFDPALLERGLAATPGVVPTFSIAIVSAIKIKYFKAPIRRQTKLHGAVPSWQTYFLLFGTVTVGHSTVMATVHFFGADLAREESYELKPGKLPRETYGA